MTSQSTSTGMTIIVTGGRAFQDKKLFDASMVSAIFSVGMTRPEIPLGKDYSLRVVHGCCPSGADRLAQYWVTTQGPTVVEARYPADWGRYNKAAGPIRNGEMIAAESDVADLCLAFWDGQSTGTLDCFMKAIKAGIRIEVVPF